MQELLVTECFFTTLALISGAGQLLLLCITDIPVQETSYAKTSTKTGCHQRIGVAAINGDERTNVVSLGRSGNEITTQLNPDGFPFEAAGWTIEHLLNSQADVI